MPATAHSFVAATQLSLMKNFFLATVLLLVGIAEGHAQFWAKSNGRFGIGDQDAFAKLQVNATSSFSNPGIALLDSSATNASGGILQFRSINYDDNHFNIQAKIGEYAFGQDSKLDFFWKDNLIMSIEGGVTPDRQLIYNPRDGIFRTGYLNPGARGEYSVAMGYSNLASGANSVALGGGNQATSLGCTALGGASTAGATYATVIGYDNHASGPYSISAGKQCRAWDVNAVAIGDSTLASGVSSHAIGYKTMASAHSSMATGHQTDATGLYSFSGGYYTQATNTSSSSFGYYTQATGVSASAFGYGTLAAGENSIALNSVTKAFGNNALASGYDTRAYGWQSSAFGNNTITRSYVSAVFGTFNDTIATSLPDGWVSTDPLLMIGNGSSHAERNNAFTIYKNGNILAKNPYPVYSDPGPLPVPASGAGTRLMWLPEKSAFRVGTVNDVSWDADSIGFMSFASGFNARATGMVSNALGSGTWAKGYASTSMGFNTKAVGDVSTALGNIAEAIGPASSAIGSVVRATGGASTAMGFYTHAKGDYTTALGAATLASGRGSSAIGNYNVATGEYAMAMGYHTNALAYGSTSMGAYNDSISISSPTSWVGTDPLIMVGNGTDDANRHNALTIYKNGNLLAKHPTAVVSDPGTVTLPATGSGTRMMWLPEKSAFRVGTADNDSWDVDSIGTWSFATGRGTIASGAYSTALGRSTVAEGDNSFASGSNSQAIGNNSTAMGVNTRAIGHNSTAFGQQTNALASWSTAMGLQTTASAEFSTAMGFSSEATGLYSLATGSYTSATGLSSTAMGLMTTASGSVSVAMGTTTLASGDYATAIGANTVASGEHATSMGLFTHAKAYASTAIGANNDAIATSSETSWVDTDPLFYIGNGTNFENTNAMVVYKNGNTDINGYTRLGEEGESAPRIKMKELPLTTAGVNYNSFVSVPHGLTVSKILSVSVLIEWDDNNWAPPEYSPSLNLRYNYYINATNVVVQNNTPSGDCLICERPVKITITYKE